MTCTHPDNLFFLMPQVFDIIKPCFCKMILLLLSIIGGTNKNLHFRIKKSIIRNKDSVSIHREYLGIPGI